jgi:CRISPR system Cascade subunit CasE
MSSERSSEGLWLSRLALNPERRDTWSDVADCHAMHRRLLMAFPYLPEVTQPREHVGLLYRIEPLSEQRISVLAQSGVAPDWSRLPIGYLLAPPEVKLLAPLYAALQPGMELVFRLQANPTRRIGAHNRHETAAWRGKRVEVRGIQAQLDWLQRKAEAAGFSVVDAHIRTNRGSAAQPDRRSDRLATARAGAQNRAQTEKQGAERVAGWRAGTGDLTLASALFEGRLRITDLAAFRAALAAGIGSGKAFGFGLLSIAPTTRSALVVR